MGHLPFYFIYNKKCSILYASNKKRQMLDKRQIIKIDLAVGGLWRIEESEKVRLRLSRR